MGTALFDFASEENTILSLFAGRTLTHSRPDRSHVRLHHHDLAKMCIHYLCYLCPDIRKSRPGFHISIQQHNNKMDKFWSSPTRRSRRTCETHRADHRISHADNGEFNTSCTQCVWIITTTQPALALFVNNVNNLDYSDINSACSISSYSHTHQLTIATTQLHRTQPHRTS